MEVLDFMNMHKNWEEMLTQPPYNIIVRRDGEYILLKYNQLGSDFSIPIVRECRGAIFWQNEDGKYECVCRAFDKFGNYGESYVPEIDWEHVTVEEKVDGSLIKVWYHNGMWHVSTNGSIDAYKCDVNDLDVTFGSLFNEAVRCDNLDDFFATLDRYSTYMFELVSPQSRVTIFYPETKLYYLGQRRMLYCMEEFKEYDPLWAKKFGILYPKTYNLNSLEDCLGHVNAMTKDEEGFVIKDWESNRMKLKSPEYLLAFHLNNNGAITTKRIVRMIKNNMIDDFMAYCSAYRDKAQKVVDKINSIADTLEHDWQHVRNVAEDGDRKEFARVAAKYMSKDYLFAKYDDPHMNAFDWVASRFTAKIMRMLKEYDV